MPRPSAPSAALAAAVRAHFGLTQAELAQFVGVSRALLGHDEAGRRVLPEAAAHRLWVLARFLPPPDGQGPPAPDFADESGAAAEAPDARVLEKRRKRLRFYIIKARFELDQRGGRARGYARRQWALHTLRPLLATPDEPGADGRLRWLGATPDAPRDLHWLDGLTIRTAATAEPLTATERALRQARLRGLEAEQAALDELLGNQEPPQ
ncbi:hypothetical protein EJV47_05890 [Hymenobacter gummosus]|uniref:Uncharacterized protein n=1 Tax=Hymenobacter gummosus TaxID=1776032 RepID=A0A3S0HBV1_9BACT|nr:helix-turn-helix domain-containing protein [Hymenobacter gummosus]RTQ52540.1 hypothetical protein EJV47_05890 [Hymenobacter gummosus]